MLCVVICNPLGRQWKSGSSVSAGSVHGRKCEEQGGMVVEPGGQFSFGIRRRK